MMLTRTIPVTQQQIDTLQGILEGREFMIPDRGTDVYWYDGTRLRYRSGDYTDISTMNTDYFFNNLLNNRFQLVPQPPEPLSDEMGELLWMHCLTTWGDRSPDKTGKLLEAKLILPFTFMPSKKGRYLLGQWLMEKNKEATHV